MMARKDSGLAVTLGVLSRTAIRFAATRRESWGAAARYREREKYWFCGYFIRSSRPRSVALIVWVPTNSIAAFTASRSMPVSDGCGWL